MSIDSSLKTKDALKRHAKKEELAKQIIFEDSLRSAGGFPRLVYSTLSVLHGYRGQNENSMTAFVRDTESTEFAFVIKDGKVLRWVEFTPRISEKS